MTTSPLRVDIISDVVCPWCIVGYRQLMKAAEATGVEIEVYWHPFELNVDMVPEGENLRDHIMRKYGSTEEQSQSARDHLTEIGADLDIQFSWSNDSRIYNTFDAHQLLHWASESGDAHKLKLALFEAYFEQGRNVSDQHILIDVVAQLGLDTESAKAALKDKRYANVVREKQGFWTSRGVSGVPTMIFDAKHATSGAQGVSTFSNILRQLT